MRKAGRLWLVLGAGAVVLIIFFLSSGNSRGGAAPASANSVAEHDLDQIKEQKRINLDLQKSAEELQLQVSKQQDANKALEETLDQLKHKRADVAELEEELARMRIDRDAVRQDLAAAEKKIAAAKKSLANIAQKKEDGKAEAKRDANGQPEKSAAEIKALEDLSFKKHWFNEYRSSQLPLNRTIPDIRVKECLPIRYDITKMPKATVIICFVNEAWSALLRTVWSVLNRSPPSLIHEIILMDDASDAEWLGQHLLDYMKANWPDKVRYVRSEKRLGLIRARLMGARAATGPVMIFLDSHCEANVGWLEPILDIIAKNRSAVVTPVIDTINDKTMDYASWISRVPAVGTFSWTMDFTWKGGVVKPGDKITDPIDSPTMAGGLFAIERQYFWDIGSYDEGMDGWGGENLEMSFRIWQCGGTLVTAPCSHVGHIFRESHPYSVPGSSIHQTFLKNSARAAEVWMDDYKRFFYNTRPVGEKVALNDFTDRVALRQKLKCRPFKWYLETLLADMFIPDDAHIIHEGALRAGDGQCLDKMGRRQGGLAGVYFCHNMGGNQAWMLTNGNELRHSDDLCLDSWSSTMPGEVHIERCHGMRGNQEWVYTEADGTVKHKASGACLTSFVTTNGQKDLKTNTCEPGAANQKWKWEGHK